MSRKTAHRKHRLAELALVVKRKHRKNWLVTCFLHHINAAFLSLDRLICAPISSLLTIAVLAVALSLPVGLEVLLQNAKFLSQNWDRGTQISLYLKMGATDKDAQSLVKQLQSSPSIAAVEYISPQGGLDTLQKSIDVSDILRQLKTNPLPAVIVLTPQASLTSPAAINALLEEVQQLPLVDNTRLDKLWVERLYYLLDLGRHCLLALFVLFGMGVILIVGNTIRLAMQNAHKEITVLKLIGATDAFVRRPFIYTGFYYGVLGSVLAWVIVTGALFWLNAPVRQLALSYASDFTLQGLPFIDIVILLGIGGALGLIGAWLAVGKHLRKN